MLRQQPHRPHQLTHKNPTENQASEKVSKAQAHCTILLLLSIFWFLFSMFPYFSQYLNLSLSHKLSFTFVLSMFHCNGRASVSVRNSYIHRLCRFSDFQSQTTQESHLFKAILMNQINRNHCIIIHFNGTTFGVCVCVYFS